MSTPESELDPRVTPEAPAPRQARNPYQWRVVDIVVASVLGVASGVVFWAWGPVSEVLSVPLAFLQPLSGLIEGGWLFAGVLGALVIRKPGAAIYVELVGGVVEALIGNHWGFSSVIWALVQGVGAEVVFAAFRYRTWTLPVALLAGLGTGLAGGILNAFTYYAAFSAGNKVIYLASIAVSGIVLAGLGSWLLVRALARTGALSQFAAGREAREV